MTKTLLCGAVAALLLAATGASAETVVPLAPFRSVGLSGGGDVVLKHGNVQRVTLIAGSTQFTRLEVRGNGNLEIEACNDSCPHNYDLRIEIVSPDIEGVAIEGGGTIRAEGGFPAGRQLDAAVSGGGEIDVRAIAAGEVNAAVNGGGDIAATATKSLNAAVSGGGDITYWGNPAVSQAVSGGGSVTHAAP